MKEKFRVSMILFIAVILLCWSGGHAAALEGDHPVLTNQPVITEISSTPTIDLKGPVVFRAEYTDSFERASLAPWTTSHIPAGGLHDWAIRDTLDTYGPGTNAADGYRYPGYPPNDIAMYINGLNPGWKSWITSPTWNISGWSFCYLSFSIWTDLEGVTDPFDGGYVEISPDNGTTWYQIDSFAGGDLDPTYDDRLVASGQSDTMWAYCYDHQEWRSVVTPDLIALGYVSAGDNVRLRFTFDRDAISGGNGFFIDDVTISETPAIDLQAPVITHTPLTDTSDWENPYIVSADVIDYGAGVDTDSVYLYYLIEGGSWVAEQMINTGGDTYEAAIPPQDWWTDIYYYIEATDLAVPPNVGTTIEYYFEIGVAKLIAYDDGIPYWAISGMVGPGDGIYNMFSFSDVGLDSVLLHKILMFHNEPSSIELKFYEYTGGFPGAQISSATGQTVMGTGYEHWDITEACGESLKVIDACMGGYIIPPGPDTLVVGTDALIDNPVNSWTWLQAGGWQQTPQTSGDFMIRLKVIELPIPDPGVAENPNDNQHIDLNLTYSKPNPMRNSTAIEYYVPTAQKVSLRIYDVSGQLIKTLLDSPMEAGTHQAVWNGLDEQGRAVSSGVYFYQLQGETENTTKKLVVTR